jgi:hypothetical protein
MKKKIIIILAGGLFIASIAITRADCFRCESGALVSTGDTMEQVQQKCGKPDGIYNERHNPLDFPKARTSTWTYKKEGQFSRGLHFIDGKLSEIRTSDER